MSKIEQMHLDRAAVVYLRQSSMAQVRNNQESQRLQYALQDRARALGWSRVETIDTDLGVSASTGRRAGFERLLSMVALGQVGIILSREVSRLSRNDQDWCRLMEVCQLFDTLIADDEQVYDLRHMDDHLVLGIKGTLSVVELGVLKMRMAQGREAKAARGELKFRLPAGYVHNVDDHPIKSPDERVRQAVELVFSRFREIQNGRQLFTWLHDEGIEMPVYQYRGGKLRLTWRVPKLLYVTGMLKNPFYAGAYVYGRRTTERVVVGGRVVKRVGKLRPAEQCRVFIPEHHEAYISWHEYQQNLEILRRNASRKPGSNAMTSAREGAGLLVGLLRCGHCGRRLHVNYWGRSGTSPRYLCRGAYPEAGDGCLSFAGTTFEKLLEHDLLNAISPFAVEASLLAEDRVRNDNEQLNEALAKRAEQLRYQASRAFEQYDAVDPKNRLVAGDLERRWNERLVASQEAEAELTCARQRRALLSEERISRLRHLGENFKEVWSSDNCSPTIKKRVVRSVLEEVVVKREEQELVFIVHWAGGSHTEHRIERSLQGAHRKTPADAIDILRTLAPRYTDTEIAAVLNRNGLKTGQSKKWTGARVAYARRRYELGPKASSPKELGFLNLKSAAVYCGVSQQTIQKLIESKLVGNEQTIPFAPYELCKRDLDSEPVQAVLKRLKINGRLDLKRGLANSQHNLFQ